MSDLERAAFAQSIVRGLGGTARSLAPRYLYDAEGSRLFEAITEQPEYYLTRVEAALLAAHADALAAVATPSTLVELGAGTATKTRHLLRAWARRGPVRYIPVDICREVLDDAAATLAGEMPGIEVQPLAGTYEQALPGLRALSPLTLCFLGSSLGNLDREEQDEFFAAVSDALAPGDHLLLGLDLVKDARVLDAAYNDAAGVTSRFTRNLFVRMNRDLGTALDLDAIEHVAWFDPAREAVQIHARFTRAATIHLADHARTFRLAKGEMIRTEVSAKFRIATMTTLGARHALDVVRACGGDEPGFALMLYRRRPHGRAASPGVAAARMIARTRLRTGELAAPLDDAALARQWSALMSPLAWDLGHIANFEEQWVRRAHFPSRRRDDPERERDHLYDAVAHARRTRGALRLLDRRGVLAYLDDVRRHTDHAIAASDFPSGDPLLRDGFVHAMLAQHEAQHTETMLQTVQLAGIPYEPARRDPPAAARVIVDPAWQAWVPAGPFLMGTDDRRFAYDNERPQHEVTLPAYRIDVALVTNAAYRRFVDEGAYRHRELWDDAGWTWLQASGVEHPGGWRRSAAGWSERAFGRDAPLLDDQPVVHVSWYEASAYARWAGKRLPTEAEWEKAAAWDLERLVPRRHPWGDAPFTPERANLDQRCFGPAAVGAYPAGVSYFGCHQMLGCVWEWMASDFGPYPGFEVFPYPEYSAIHFARGHKVLRGGSWATQPIVARNTLRNWDLPERRQIFAGFRCASDC